MLQMKHVFSANLTVIRKKVACSRDDFITEFFSKYSELDLSPVWKTLKVISIDTLSKLYSNFSDSTVKHAMVWMFELNHRKFLRSRLECLVVLCNCCVYHSKLSL